MLTGASAGETYAADALNRDVVTQLLTHYQRKLQEFFYERAMIVAEAQGHFDYEIRNGERYLLTEEIFEIDEETGEEIIKEIPKLLVPDLKFKILNLTDETAQQEFIEALAAAGVPVPIRERIKTTGLDFEEMIEVKQQETVDLAVAEQETRREIYLKLKAAGLPIPDDLLKDFSPKAQMAGQATPPLGASDVAISQLGISGPQDLPVLAPTPDDLMEDQSAAEDQMMDDATNEMTDPMGGEGEASEDQPEEGDDVPSESNEQKERMPKKSSYSIWQTWTHEQREAFRKMPDDLVRPAVEVAAIKKKTAKNIKKIAKQVGRLQIRQATKRYYVAPDNSQERSPQDWRPTGKFGAPKHLGMRHFLDIPEDLKYRKDDED
jgi:hypothetical protein